MRCADTIRIQAILSRRQQRFHHRSHGRHHSSGRLRASHRFVPPDAIVHVPSEGEMRCCATAVHCQFSLPAQKISVSLSQFGFNPFTVRPRASIFPRNSVLHFGQVQLRGNTLPPDPMPKPPSVNPSSSPTLRVSCCRHTTSLVNFCARNAVVK